jgi:hypothetical protein
MHRIPAIQRIHAACIGGNSCTSAFTVTFRHWNATPAASASRSPRVVRAESGFVMPRFCGMT